MARSAFLGLRTVIYQVPDLDAAKAWYARALDIEPYFDEPFYVGFDVGGYELGLLPDEGDAPGGVRAYWGVEDVRATLQALLDQGAQLHSDVQDVGGGIELATVLDPYGNLVGIIYNPHFKVAAS